MASPRLQPGVIRRLLHHPVENGMRRSTIGLIVAFVVVIGLNVQLPKVKQTPKAPIPVYQFVPPPTTTAVPRPRPTTTTVPALPTTTVPVTAPTATTTSTSTTVPLPPFGATTTLPGTVPTVGPPGT